MCMSYMKPDELIILIIFMMAYLYCGYYLNNIQI